MSDSIDEIRVLDDKIRLTDKVDYDTSKGWVIANGASLLLKKPSLDRLKPGNWCEETKPRIGSMGDKGSPRAKTGGAP